MTVPLTVSINLCIAYRRVETLLFQRTLKLEQLLTKVSLALFAGRPGALRGFNLPLRQLNLARGKVSPSVRATTRQFSSAATTGRNHAISMKAAMQCPNFMSLSSANLACTAVAPIVSRYVTRFISLQRVSGWQSDRLYCQAHPARVIGNYGQSEPTPGQVLATT